MELRPRLRVRSRLLLATAVGLFAAAFGVLALPPEQPAQAAQSIPYKINFQGRLTDNAGNALSDGLYNIKFRLWTLNTGGTNQWQADRVRGAADNRVQVTNGLFNIQFGDTTLGDPALSPSLFNTGTGTLYLEVELPTPATATCATNGCAVFTEGAMTPRQPLASAAYAFNADTIDGLDSSSFGQLSAVQSWTDTNTFSKSGGAAIVLSGSAASGGSILQIGSALIGGNGSGTLFGANTTATGDLVNLQVSGALKLKVDTTGGITTAGDFQFAAGSNRGLTVGQAASGGGNALTIQAGQSATGAFNGGDLVLQAGASGGTGTSGSVKIIANGTDTSTAFQVQDASGAPAFTIDTTANKIIVGDATGTNTGTSLLVIDSATTDPATGYNGAQYYNTTSNVFRCYQGGAWTTCGGTNITATANSTASFLSGLANVAGTTTGVAVETLVFTAATTVSNTAGVTGFTAPASGSFRTCLTKNNAAITAGTLNLRWRVNGVSVGAPACPMSATTNRQSASSIDSGVVTFAAGDTIGIAYDTVGMTPAASNDFTTYWSVEYNASSGNGLSLQFVYNSSTSPAAITLSDNKNLVVNAAETSSDPNIVFNLQCTTCSVGGGKFAVQNNGTDAFVVNPNNSGIELNQSATLSAGSNLTLAPGTGTITQSYSSVVAGASGQVLGYANTNTAAGVAIQGVNLTPTNTATPSSGTNTLNVLNFAAGGALGASNVTNGLNFASSTGYSNFIKTPSTTLNNQGDLTSTFTLLNGTSTANGAGANSASLVLASATNFDIGNYVQVNSANCGGAGVNPCYAKITNKAVNTLTITPALTWANGSTVNEYHIPEIGATNTASTLANRYGRGYFIAGVAAGNGTTFYNEDSVETTLSTFDLLTSSVATLNIGTAATSLTLGSSGTTVNVPGDLSVTGNITAPATGTSGYLSRSGTTLTPTTAGDNISTSGNISTTGTGTITSASTVTGTTINGTTGINTGAGAGTQRIDASGNLVNIGSVTATGAISGTGVNAGSGVIQGTGGLTLTGSITQTFSATNGIAETKNVTASGASGANTVTGLAVNLTGTNNATGSNTLTALNIGNVAAATNNTYRGINFGTGFSSLLSYNGGTVIINGTGQLNGAQLQSGTVANASLANSSVTVTAGTGLTGGGAVSLGGSTSLAVAYGSAANTAVQGNVAVTCPSGTGNLTGGGTAITLGTGGTCAALSTIQNPTFTTSVTSPIFTGTAAVTVSSGGTSGLTLDSASNVLSIAPTDTTLQRTAAGNYTIDLNDAAANSLIVTNSGTGVASLSVEGGVSIGAGQTYKVNGTQISSADLSNDASITKQGNTFNGNTQLVQTTAAGALPAISGANLTNLNPTNLVQGSGAVLLQSAAGTALTITANAASTFSTSAGQLTLQSGSGTVSLGSSTTLTAAGALTIDSGTISALNIGSGANAKTITLGNTTGGTTVTISSGTGGINVGDDATAKTIDIGGVSNSGTDTINIATNATAADTITIGNVAAATKVVLNAGPSTTTSGTSGVQIGSTTADATQINLQLDSSNVFAEAANTCTTTVNQGALYYNSASTALRTCVNGAWEDVMTTAGLGLYLFGVVADSSNAVTIGDIYAISGNANSPCKVRWTAAQQVTVSPCIAYSAGRKVVVASTAISTAGVAANAYVNVCLSATGVPALQGTASTVETTASQPAFSANNPVLCLATLRMTAAAGTVGNIYDIRTFTVTQKMYATINAVNALGWVVVNSATANQVATTTTAAAGSIRGVIVATTGTASTTTPNLIIATGGPQFVKATAVSNANATVGTSTTAGYTTTGGAATNTYSVLGLSTRTVDAACNAITNCQFSQFTDIHIR